MTRRKGILGTTEIKRNILLTFWDKKKRGFLLRLRDGGSIYLMNLKNKILLLIIIGGSSKYVAY
jgi:hypothetical protein